MKKFKCVVITGASGGIGKELARRVAPDCEMLVLINRDRERLLELQKELSDKYSADVIIFPGDLTDPAVIPEIEGQLKFRNAEVEVLMNNAGVGSFGPFNEVPWETSAHIIHLNILALCHLTRLFMNQMIRNRRGYILNVASTAAFLPGPMMAVYYASKAFVLSFSLAMTRELSGTGVSCTTLCPGPTKTGFQKMVGSEQSRLSRWNLLASPGGVADFAYRAMLRRKRVAVPGMWNRMLVNLIRVIPGWLLLPTLHRLQKMNRRRKIQAVD